MFFKRTCHFFARPNVLKFTAITTVTLTITLQKPLYADIVSKINPPQIVSPLETQKSFIAKKKQESSNHSFLLDLLKKDWLLFGSIIAVTACSASVAVYIPLAIGKLVTAIQGFENINLPTLEIVGLFVGQSLLTLIDISLVTRLGENLAASLRNSVFQAMLLKDQSYLDKTNSSEIQSLQTDIQELKHTIKKTITRGLSAGFQIIGSILSLLHTSMKLSFTLATFLPAVYLGMSLYGRYLRYLSTQCRKIEQDSLFQLGQVYRNLKTVRAFVAEETEMKKYALGSYKIENSNLWLGINIGGFQSLVIGSIGSAMIGVLYFGGQLVLKGEMTGGQLMAFLVQTQNAQKALSSMGVLFSQLVKSMSSVERLRLYIQYDNKIPIRGGVYPRTFKGDIQFDNVSFTYPTRDQPVLRDFSVDIKNGSMIALCGKSGSGKSTVGQLIERFYDTDRGTITIDGHDIRTLDPKFVRENIGYINQEPSLFATTVMENIRYGRPDATNEQVIRAAKDANVDEFVRDFPEGYNTVVGEHGASLSGGQKQRVAIARALLRDPKVLILDEATSALDSNSEKIVQEALDRLMQGRTVLVIAHRLSTIKKADCIIVMGDTLGNILEKGTHQELLKQKGEYYKLHQQLA